MQCGYFDAGVCRSCTLMGVPHATQVQTAQQRLRTLLPQVPQWLPPAVGAEAGFRNRAKMVVGGTTTAPTLGILDERGHGVDLQGCGLYPPALSRAFTPLAAFVTRAALVPYDVPARRGELKHVHVTLGSDDALMVRFVLRSTESLPRLRKHLPWLQTELPALRAASANLLPAHAALLEGDVEVPLADAARLPVHQGDVTLLARPQGFLQTNTEVAGALYRQAAAWLDDLPADQRASVWDLYCGAGGFALHLARTGGTPGPEVVGVETSEQAVAAAADAAVDAGLSVRFVSDDATAWAQRQREAPDVVVVNPPRRGLGARLCAWLDDGGQAPRHLLYSSCNAESLARDLAALPSWTPVRGRLFAMFPQSTHHEVLVQLTRR